MRPGTVVLAHGPLDPPGWWGPVAGKLRQNGLHVIAPELMAGAPPYSVGWVAGMARPLHAAAVPTPLALVAHGTAGPLLPALARTQRAARRAVGGYVFVDSSLPRPGAQTHLDLLRAADAGAADRMHDSLHHEAASNLDEPPLAADHAFWSEPLPPAIDWPDAPCAYVRSSSAGRGVGSTRWWARSAEQRGWLVDDSARDLAETVADVIDRLAG